MKDADLIALDAAHQIEALPSDLHKAQKTARIQLIVLAALSYAQPQSLPGCQLHGPGECQKKGKCMSEACVHYNKTWYGPRMCVEPQVDGILYPEVETKT